MKLKVRHYLYLIGLITFLSSYLLDISMPFISFLILAFAILISFVAFVIIAVKDSLKTILIFVFLGIITICFRIPFKEWATTKYYNSIITRNEKIFEKVNNILSSKKRDISYPFILEEKDSIFSVIEIQTLNQFLKETKIGYIRKDKKKIFYPIWGVPLEMDYGIFFFYSGDIPTKDFKHLNGNWYYD